MFVNIFEGEQLFCWDCVQAKVHLTTMTKAAKVWKFSQMLKTLHQSIYKITGEWWQKSQITILINNNAANTKWASESAIATTAIDIKQTIARIAVLSSVKRFQICQNVMLLVIMFPPISCLMFQKVEGHLFSSSHTLSGAKFIWNLIGRQQFGQGSSSLDCKAPKT